MVSKVSCMLSRGRLGGFVRIELGAEVIERLQDADRGSMRTVLVVALF